jgi:hypothetical protein
MQEREVAGTRDRFRVSGGKSDRFDAFVLCELARTAMSVGGVSRGVRRGPMPETH